MFLLITSFNYHERDKSRQINLVHPVEAWESVSASGGINFLLLALISIKETDNLFLKNLSSNFILSNAQRKWYILLFPTRENKIERVKNFTFGVHSLK